MTQHAKKQLAIVLATALAVSSISYAGSAPTDVKWNGTDSMGNPRAIPVADRATLIVLVRPGQSQSKETLDQVKGILKNTSPQVLLVVSGEQAVEQSKTLAQTDGTPGPVIADKDFSLAGDLGVHVWPEVIVVDSKGKCVGRLPGLRQTGATEITAYLDLADGKISPAELDAKLKAPTTIVADKAGSLHLQVARQQLAGNKTEEAMKELDLGLKDLPNDPSTQLLAARLLVTLHRDQEGLEILTRIPESAAPAAQRNVIRARALIQTGQWNDAITLLQATIKVSPEPAEAQYLLGIALQHENQPDQAAAAFRASTEAAIAPELRLQPSK